MVPASTGPRADKRMNVLTGGSPPWCERARARANVPRRTTACFINRPRKSPLFAIPTTVIRQQQYAAGRRSRRVGITTRPFDVRPERIAPRRAGPLTDLLAQAPAPRDKATL